MWQRSEVDHIRSQAVVMKRIRPTLVEKCEVPLRTVAGIGYRVVGVQVHFLILKALPQPLDKYVVSPGALPVHAVATNAAESLFQISGILICWGYP